MPPGCFNKMNRRRASVKIPASQSWTADPSMMNVPMPEQRSVCGDDPHFPSPL